MGLAEAIGKDVEGLGGFLKCRDCTYRLPLGDVGDKLAQGWPKCPCNGQTMEWVTQRQIDGGYLDDPEGWTARQGRAT